MTSLARLPLAALAVAGSLAFAGAAYAGCAGHQSADSGTLQTAMNDTAGTPKTPAPTPQTDRK